MEKDKTRDCIAANTRYLTYVEPKLSCRSEDTRKFGHTNTHQGVGCPYFINLLKWYEYCILCMSVTVVLHNTITRL